MIITASHVAAARTDEPVDFRRQVLPILQTKCLRCHGAKRQAGKLDLRTREAMLRGGNSGAAIEPGKADKSLLVELIRFNEMPPKKDQPRVSEDELKLLKAWINAGAPKSPTPETKGILPSQTHELSHAETRVFAFLKMGRLYDGASEPIANGLGRFDGFGEPSYGLPTLNKTKALMLRRAELSASRHVG